MPSKSIITAAGCGNLEELVLRCDSFVKVHDVKEYYLSEWVDVGFQPPNLNIVLHKAAYMNLAYWKCYNNGHNGVVKYQLVTLHILSYIPLNITSGILPQLPMQYYN